MEWLLPAPLTGYMRRKVSSGRGGGSSIGGEVSSLRGEVSSGRRTPTANPSLVWLSPFVCWSLFSRSAPRFALILFLPWLTTRSPITVNGSPLQEDATHPNFLWEEDATHPILCGIRDADAESVTRRRTMGARGGRGQ